MPSLRAILGYLKALATPPPAVRGLWTAERPTPIAITLITNDGREIHGERRNEDAFSIQIAEPGGRLQGYLKSNVRSIVRGERAPRWRPHGDPLPGVTYRDILDGLKDPGTLAHLLGRLHAASVTAR